MDRALCIRWYGLSIVALLTLGLILAGCSSSSTETPPQLRPDGPVGRVLVVGDSVAFLTAQGLARIQVGHNLRVSNGGTPGCGVIRGGETLRDGEWMPESQFCQGWPSRWRSIVGARDPEVVVLLSGFWDVFDRRLADGTILEFGSDEADADIKQDLSEAMNILTAEGAHVIILTTPYFAPGEESQSPSARDESRVDHLNDILWDMEDEREGVSVVDLNKLLTPGGYRSEIDGVDVRGDGVHLTPAGQRYVAEWLAPYLVEAVINTRTAAQAA
jgi:hypothetical protein